MTRSIQLPPSPRYHLKFCSNIEVPESKIKMFNIVCPATGGIALHLARQLLQRTKNHLIATTRSSPEALKALILSSPSNFESRLTIISLNPTSPASITGAAKEISTRFPFQRAKYIFSTAGVLFPERSLNDVELESVKMSFEVNVFVALFLMRGLEQFIVGKNAKGEENKIIQDRDDVGGGGRCAVWSNISARVGSTSDNKLGGWYSYRASKAALNSLTKTFDIHLSQKCGNNAICVSLHPGTVKTRLSKQFWNHVPKEQLFEPEFAAGKLLDVVMSLRPELHRGKFFDWKGHPIEW